MANSANEEVISHLNDKLKKHIDEVLEVYGVESAYELERRTHAEDPWKLARNGLPLDAESTAIITIESMKKFFQKQP